MPLGWWSPCVPRSRADLLRPYLPARSPARPPNVLELFARTALAGPVAAAERGEEGRGTWLSVGNEACKFNVVDRGGTRGWLRGNSEVAEA